MHVPEEKIESLPPQVRSPKTDAQAHLNITKTRRGAWTISYRTYDHEEVLCVQGPSFPDLLEAALQEISQLRAGPGGKQPQAK
jgi:hypothetical protein